MILPIHCQDAADSPSSSRLVLVRTVQNPLLALIAIRLDTKGRQCLSRLLLGRVGDVVRCFEESSLHQEFKLILLSKITNNPHFVSPGGS